MKTLFLIRGLPGSGKSTVAESILPGQDCCVLAADDYFTNTFTGEYNFDAKKLSRAHKNCHDRCAMCMINDVEFIAVHNTFTTEKEMTPYFDLAKEHNYIVHTLIVENRHGNESVHNVPKETIERMRDRFSLKL